jgi:hypothetical protein
VYTPFPPAQLPRKVRASHVPSFFAYFLEPDLFPFPIVVFRSIYNWNPENISSKLQIERPERSRGENKR